MTVGELAELFLSILPVLFACCIMALAALFLAFNVLFPYNLWRCVEACIASVVALLQGRRFWLTLRVLWPRVRF